MLQMMTWEDVPAERIGEKVERRVVWGSQANYTRFSLQRGAHVLAHHHPSEQFTAVAEGALRLKVGEQEFVLRPGCMLVIPPHVEHEAWADEDTVVLDFFAPPRRDWQEGRSQYLTGRS